jgi:flavin reductase (NADH)
VTRSPEWVPAGFRNAMAAFPTGVCVVTAFDHTGHPRGMTCSSLCSVSMDPPTLLVCLRAGSPTLAAIEDRGRFAVNLLHHGGQGTAELFASGEPSRFDRVRWQAPTGAAPHLLDDAHAVADCLMTATQLVGDHVVVYGEVLDVIHRPQHRPLLYGLRRYTAWPHY